MEQELFDNEFVIYEMNEIVLDHVIYTGEDFTSLLLVMWGLCAFVYVISRIVLFIPSFMSRWLKSMKRRR